MESPAIELNTLSYPSSGANTPGLSSTRSNSPTRTLFKHDAPEDAATLPPVDKGLGAWLFVLNAWFLETFIWGASFSYGITQVSIGSVGTIALAIQYMATLFLCQVFRRYPDKVKIMLWAATLASVLGFLLSAFATQVWHLILLQGVVCGSAGAVLYTPVLLWMSEWFHLKRGTVSGIIFSGTGVGGAVLPIFFNTMLQKYGFRWTFITWALIVGVVFTGCVATIKPRLPMAKPNKGERGPFFPLDATFLRHPIVIVMTLTTFLSSLSFFPVSLYLSTYVEGLGTVTDATYVLVVFNSVATAGQVITGIISDRFPPWMITATLGLASSTIALTAWGTAKTVSQTFGLAVLFGAFSGICSTWTACARDVTGTNVQGSTLIISMFGVARGTASIVGPIIASKLFDERAVHDASGWAAFGFRKIIIFVGCLAFASGVSGGALACFKGPNRKPRQSSFGLAGGRR
ncbi:hypothetical protein OIO90_003942 [Microbotryomycetes sp. JL221]|nr:hypothetical protein OIO90_003942 [Microbotryomycetes sp. JL221]